MIKVQNNIATREPIPQFLMGLAPESLSDLSWTDPALGVSDCAWWPEVDQSPPAGRFEKYGAETLSPDQANQVVVVISEVVPMTDEEKAPLLAAISSDIVDRTQQRLDTFARTRGYDGIMSASTYAASTVPRFSSDGQYVVQARDATWTALYAILADVHTGTRTVPSGFAEIESELPVLVWPEVP